MTHDMLRLRGKIGPRGPFDGVAHAEFETIRRGRGRRPQIIATRKGKWAKAKEALFFDALRQCGNVAASGRGRGEWGQSLVTVLSTR